MRSIVIFRFFSHLSLLFVYQCITFLPLIFRFSFYMPALFIVYYSSISLFMHVHVENGTTIVHSHPFERAADGTYHHHSSLSEIQLFHLLTTVHVQDGAIHSLLLQIYVTPNYKIIDNPVYPDYLVPVLGKLSLRAPPFV